MFEYHGGLPEDWVPIPAEEWASLEPLPADGLPVGTTAEYADSCDRLVDRAVGMGPGGAALSLLSAVPPEALSKQARSRALAELTAVSAHLAAVSSEFTASIAGGSPSPDPCLDASFASHEVAVATRTSVYTADAAIALSRDLATVLQASRSAMRRGELSHAQTRLLHGATTALPADVARAVERRVLGRSSHQTTKAFRTCVDRAVAALDPTFTARSRQARAEVEVTHTAFGDGVGQLYVRGPLETTATINLALTGYAVRTKETLGGTVDQRKLAGLRDWAEAAQAAPDAPIHHGRRPTVNVVVELPTLLGLNHHPAEIPGIGPLPADAASWLIADGAPLRRLVTDPAGGQLLDYGTSTYEVPPALADYLIARNVCSAAPHSPVDARVSDMEHNIPHELGGPTNPINVTPVDRRWHRAKTHAGWTYTKGATGTIIWTSPNGLTCRIEPHDYRLGP